MIKVFIPTDKKNKSVVRGLWVNDKGKIYYDYLKIQHHSFLNPSVSAKEYNQEAIFYIKNEQGYCFDNKTKLTEVFSKKIVFEIGFDRHNLKGILKRALRDYKGCTIYKVANGYRIEAYYNE
jgi:hypothetical protein